MMLYLSSSSPIRNRPRSNSQPVHLQRDGRLPEAEENLLPVRPARNPSRPRPATFGEEQLAPPPVPEPKLSRAPADNDDCWEGVRVIGPEERHKPSVNVTSPKPLVNRKQQPQSAPLPQINTLDRKIAQELQRSMLARSAQFAVKKGTKHHPFPPDEVPYPRSYDHKCIDTDVWETLFCEQFCGNVTFHTFDVPPTKVLDLGCGSGSWIMSCARKWKNCHFVGLDIVPLHPDLGQLELSKRVNWVQANFLEPLPFPNEEFDFVHIKRIARGVPENKWDALFEEIIRVMKPGAALEMLEEDLYIPGQMIDHADTDSPLSTAPSSGSSSEPSQSPVSSRSGFSISPSDVSTRRGSSSSQIRRSTSEKVNRSPVSQSGSNTIPSPLSDRPTPPVPDYSRVFPRPKISPKTGLPVANHFSLQNLRLKRSGRDDGKNKETAPPVSSGASLYSLSTSGGSVTLNRKRSTKKTHRPSSSGGGLPTPKLYFNTAGTSSNLMLGSNTSINILPLTVPPQHKLGTDDRSLALPQVENTNGNLGVDYSQNGRNDESKLPRMRSFSCPSPEDDGQRRYSANGESEAFDLSTVGMHDHVQQVRSRNSGVPTDTEPVELNRRDQRPLTILQFPLPPAKDIPMRSEPRAIPSSSWPSEASGSTNGLPRSAPDRVTDYSGRTGDNLLSPTLEGTIPKPIKSLSTSSLGICTSASLRSPIQETPPNPRQHNLLEVIYSEMHATRFVNLAPLSLLENYIRTYFKSVRTHAPLIFAFPPPPGCDHRPEFDAVELQWNVNRMHGAGHDDDQDRYLRPDTSPSLTPSPSIAQLNNLRSIPPRPARERSQSVTTNEPGPSRARSSGTKLTRPSATGFETPTLRQPRSNSSNLFVGPVDVTVSDRLVVTGNGLLSGTSEYVMMDRSVIEGLSPARVAKAARESASSASEERERSRHRADSLFTCSNDAKGKREGGERRKRALALPPSLTRPPPTGPLPPLPSFEYKYPNSASSTSLSPSIASSSSSTSTIVQYDSGKGRRGLTVPEGAHLSAFPNQGTEIDVRSLNLHLRVRVVEILGCSEAMWDWVKEFQHRELELEKEKKPKEQQKPKTFVGGGRVSYYHHDRARQAGGRARMNSAGSEQALRHKRSTRGFTVGTGSEKRGGDGDSVNGHGQGTFVKVSGSVAESPTSYFTTSFGSVKEDDPSERTKKVRQELLHLTRERFDEVLSWFQFDMDDSIRLTRSMATRTPSSPFPTDPTDQRKTFDTACQKLETYLHQYPGSPTSFIKPRSIASGDRSISDGSSLSQRSEEELCCLPPLLNLVHPSKRLCRTIRVWVAWKP